MTMSALEASERLQLLNKRIESLNTAYHVLWKDFDSRTAANVLDSIQSELEMEREDLKNKMQSLKV